MKIKKDHIIKINNKFCGKINKVLIINNVHVYYHMFLLLFIIILFKN